MSESERPNQSETDGGDGVGRSPAIWKLSLLAAGFAAILAFRSVVGAPAELNDSFRLATWLFNPSQDSRLIAIGVAVWLFWMHRKELVACAAPRVTRGHWLAATATLLLFCGATWLRAPLLSLLCACSFAATISHAWGRTPATRAIAMACVALLLSLPPPNPLFSEIVWWLQGVSVQGAYALLSLGGLAVEIEGTEIRLGQKAFAVIEACSGWRGISLLLIIALVAAELQSLAPLRTAVLVALAVPLGILLNVARIAFVILTQRELSMEMFENHTPQGIAVLLVGTMIIYAAATGLSLLSPSANATPASEPGKGPMPGHSTDIDPFIAFGRFTLGLATALAVVSVALPWTQGAAPGVVTHRRPPTLSLDADGWTGSLLDPDYYFPYDSGDHPQFRAEFLRLTPRGAKEIVDVFIALESPQLSGLNRLPASKLSLPAGDWEIESRETQRVSQLSLDADVTIVSRGGESAEYAYVTSWRVHDSGLLQESLLSLVGRDACNLAGSHCARTVVRLTTPIFGDVERGLNRAVRTTQNFMRSFRMELMNLPNP